jgi:cytoskeletal protein CcmA (bactofilin family)
MADDQKIGCLMVGEGVISTGQFQVPDIAFISGQVDGDLTAREVVVGVGGVVRGNLIADVVEVRGEVQQNVVAHRFLFIRSTGKVKGSVTYTELEIEKGGDIQGSLIRAENNYFSNEGL